MSLLLKCYYNIASRAAQSNSVLKRAQNLDDARWWRIWRVKMSLSKAHTLFFAVFCESDDVFSSEYGKWIISIVFQGNELQGKLLLFTRRRAKEKINLILFASSSLCAFLHSNNNNWRASLKGRKSFFFFTALTCRNRPTTASSSGASIFFLRQSENKASAKCEWPKQERGVWVRGRANQELQQFDGTKT